MSDAADYLDRAKIEEMILAKVAEDPAFGARLKADAKAALSEMFDTKLPASVKVHVFQETPSELMIRLPIVANGEVSEAELEGVAGGLCAPMMGVRPLPSPGRPPAGFPAPGFGRPPSKRW